MGMTEHLIKSAPDPVGAYPHARQAGDFLFLSGVGPRTPGSNEIPGNHYDEDGNLLSYDIVKQCHSVIANIKTILNSCGANWNDLVDITVFLTDMKTDFVSYNKIYAEYFDQCRPCRTTVEVGALPTDIAVEFKCIAHVQNSS